VGLVLQVNKMEAEIESWEVGMKQGQMKGEL
jgi:hypothetical protein